MNESDELRMVNDLSINNSDRFKMESYVESTKSSAMSLIPEVSNPVIGVFSGIFAKLDSMSVNKRFYSEDFWRKVLSSSRVKEALRSGSMIGIFEHPNVMGNYDKQGNPTCRHPQNGAFVVKRLWIEGRNVMGEAYLLNTPLGRLLATYFLAKDRFSKPLIELFISARGYSKNDYFDDQGIDQMNPNDYLLQSFDVVMNPGIKGARVKMESDETDRIDEQVSEYLDRLESFTEEVSRYYERVAIAQSLKDELNLKSI